MKIIQVRCWHVRATGRKDDLLITYPEDNQGHALISCLECGAVYAVTVAKQVYFGPPLEQKLQRMKCINCGALLAKTYAAYPDRYRDDNGNVREYDRSSRIPDDEDSIVAELPDIYS
jgi:RNase P subunit RPR2